MPWITVASSVLGTSHEATDSECQDRHQVALITSETEGEIVVAVVADGAGTASFGGEGAELTCRAFVDEIQTHFEEGFGISTLDPDFGRDFAATCQEQLRILAEDRNLSTREFASTFVACVISSEDAVFFQIGDGGAVYASTDNLEAYLMAIPTLPGIYSNVTQFITDGNALDCLRYARIPLALSKVALFTDGLQNLAVDYKNDEGGVPFHPFFAPMFAPLMDDSAQSLLNAQLTQFLSSPPINDRTDDDKTLLLIGRNP